MTTAILFEPQRIVNESRSVPDRDVLTGPAIGSANLQADINLLKLNEVLDHGQLIRGGYGRDFTLFWHYSGLAFGLQPRPGGGDDTSKFNLPEERHDSLVETIKSILRERPDASSCVAYRSTWQQPTTPMPWYHLPIVDVGNMVQTIQEVAQTLEPLATVGKPSEERKLVDDDGSSAYRVVPVRIPAHCDFNQFYHDFTDELLDVLTEDEWSYLALDLGYQED